MDTIKSVIFLHDLEIELLNETQKFEEEIRIRWTDLPNLEEKTIYHICPYFDGIDTYFKKGLMSIADSACRKYQNFTGQSKEISWFSICNDYPEVIEKLCAPYIEAFEAVSSKGLDRLKATRKKLEMETSNRTHGYITNSIGFALAWETANAISDALKTVENNNRAWQTATEPQTLIHKQLSVLWKNSFNKDFMKKVSEENERFVNSIISAFCFDFGYTYEKYLSTKETPDFKCELDKFKNKQSEQKKKDAIKKHQEKEKYLSIINNEINLIDVELSNIGFAFWGEKGSKKKELRKKKERLLSEICAFENPIPLQSTYIAFINHYTTVYDTFIKSSDKWYNCKEYWKFEYSEQHEDYVAYTPQGEPLFTLGQSFLQRYGRNRLIRAKYIGCPTDNYQTLTAQLEFSIFEITE